MLPRPAAPAPTWRLILNGKAAADDAVRDAVHRLRADGIALGVRVTWEPGDATRFVRLAIEDGVDAVIAGGGDGTLSEVAAAVAALVDGVATLPAIGVLPLGTGNDFATAAGLPTDPYDALDLLRHTDPHPVDLLRVHARGREHWCANLASGGFGTQVTVETSEGMKKILGSLAYLITGIAQLGKIETTRATIRGPGFHWRGDFIALGLGNGRQAGGGQVLCPGALVDDGLIDVTIVPELSGEVGATVAGLLTGGREAALERVAVRARLPWVELEAPDGVLLNLDGEPVEDRRLRVECVPGHVRMHLPAGCPLLSVPRVQAIELAAAAAVPAGRAPRSGPGVPAGR